MTLDTLWKITRTVREETHICHNMGYSFWYSERGNTHLSQHGLFFLIQWERKHTSVTTWAIHSDSIQWERNHTSVTTWAIHSDTVREEPHICHNMGYSFWYSERGNTHLSQHGLFILIVYSERGTTHLSQHGLFILIQWERKHTSVTTWAIHSDTVREETHICHYMGYSFWYSERGNTHLSQHGLFILIVYSERGNTHLSLHGLFILIQWERKHTSVTTWAILSDTMREETHICHYYSFWLAASDVCERYDLLQNIYRLHPSQKKEEKKDDVFETSKWHAFI